MVVTTSYVRLVACGGDYVWDVCDVGMSGMLGILCCRYGGWERHFDWIWTWEWDWDWLSGKPTDLGCYDYPALKTTRSF